MTFKVRLLLGAAFPFVFVLPAAAQVSISTATTTPVQTSTANSGAASDVSVTSTGSITLTDAAAASTAVTIDSSNTVNNAGTISTVDSDNTVGVRILPNLNNSLTSTGTISLIEDYTREDTDDDDDEDGPLAIGTGRVGVLVEPGGVMNGGINIGGQITVEGNDSYGLSVRSGLNGNYTQSGGIVVIGTNGVAVDVREDVTGNLRVQGTTLAQGEGSVGLKVLGDIAGEFMIGGSVSATGFTSTTISNYADPDDLDADDPTIAERRDPDDLLIGGSAVEIRSNLARGLLLNGIAVGGADSTPDVKDAIQNFNEDRTTASINSFGSAPALLIQSADGVAGSDIVLSRVRESVQDTTDDDDDDNVTEVIGVFDYDYGLVNRGSINGDGLNVGFAATGLKIAGSADGTHTTTVEGGVFNGGSISARSFEANATGFNLGAGASMPLLLNTGSITAQVSTETDHDAVAMRIDAGASLPTITNNGAISATTRGWDGDAIAVQDLSGTLTNFTNSSRIVAGHIDDDSADDVSSGAGRTIAFDLSHGTSNITLTQNDGAVDNARIFGDVLFGGGNDQLNVLSGEVLGNVNFGAGADTLAMTSAKLTGDATFAGSNATVALAAAELRGNLSLGGAAGSLSFTNQSVYNGAITRTGAGPMTLTANNSTVNNSGADTLNLTSMSLSSATNFGIVVDNSRIASGLPILNVSGTADIAANTLFTPIFSQFTNQPFTVRVIDAAVLNLGGPLDTMLNANSPYLYNLDLSQPNPNAIDLTMTVKTASQLGLNTRQASAYAGVLDLLEEDDETAAAVTSLTGANEFIRGWQDLLPGSDAAVMHVLSSNATAAFGATARRLDMISNKPNAPGGAWAEEFGVFHKADASSRANGVEGGGFGVAAGIDVLSTGTALLGAFASIESAELEEETRTAAPLNVSQTSFGLYGGWINGNLAINGAASFGSVEFTSDRKIELGDLSDQLRAEWKGQTYTAGARATYNVPVMTWLDLKPFVAADYVGFTQDAYRENATTNEALEIIAGDGDASLATASYGLSLVGNLGSDDAYAFRPELSVGYRNVLNWENNPATLRFAGNTAGTSFQLDPGVEPEDAIVAGLGLNFDSQFLNIKVGYDAEIADASMTHYGSITLRLAFW
jgi:hypothetical protein